MVMAYEEEEARRTDSFFAPFVFCCCCNPSYLFKNQILKKKIKKQTDGGRRIVHVMDS